MSPRCRHVRSVIRAETARGRGRWGVGFCKCCWDSRAPRGRLQRLPGSALRRQRYGVGAGWFRPRRSPVVWAALPELKVPNVLRGPPGEGTRGDSQGRGVSAEPSLTSGGKPGCPWEGVGEPWARTAASVSHRRLASPLRSGPGSSNEVTPQPKDINAPQSLSHAWRP